jgi:hypothetical protein
MPRSRPRPRQRADELLEAQIRFHLDRLSGEDLDETVRRLADGLLDASGKHPIADLVNQDAITAIVGRALATVPGSAAVGGLVELAADVAYDGPGDARPLGEIVDRDRVEAVLDELLGLVPVLDRALDRLVASPLVGTAASRFMGRIVGEVLQANKAVTDKVPGLSSLMSFGTSAASRVMGAADKQFEGLIGDTVGKGGTFAVRRLNRILVETLRDPTTREAVLQVWDLVAAEPAHGLDRYVDREQLTGVVDAGHELVVTALASEPVAQLAEVVVGAFFDRFGGYTPTEMLDELDLDRGDLVADLVLVAPGVVGAPRDSGDLERLLRAQLEPFYASEEVRAILDEG